MWNISRQAKEVFTKRNTLPIPESDEEWEIILRAAEEEGEDLISYFQEELEDVREELLQILPDRFIPYVEKGILNQPTLPRSVREDYLQWIQEANKKFEKILDATHEQTSRAVSSLSTDVQDVFTESLHDSTIERIERRDNSLHLYINTDGGFSSKAIIHFIFENIITEESDEPLEVGQWIIYYELQKTNEGYAFRILFDCPDAEWTITMENLHAQYFYRPAPYTILNHEEKLDETSLEHYIQQLNPDFHYWVSTPHVTCPIQSFVDTFELQKGKLEMNQNEFVVNVGHTRFIYDRAEYHPIQFIYTDIYEDPYAHLNEPLPADEIEAAALGNDLELQVRAWNTMYASPQEFTKWINIVFSKMKITEENEMLASVYVNHFYQNGILTEAIFEKYRTLID